MNIEPIARSGRGFWFVILLFVLTGCAPAPRFYLHYGKELKQAELDRLLVDNPLGAAENIKITTLGHGPSVSHHLVQVRHREEPHVHNHHDGTVVILRGNGYLMIDARKLDLVAGDTVHIPRGIVHFFVNAGRAPAVAFVVFAPPFDGKDSVPVKIP